MSYDEDSCVVNSSRTQRAGAFLALSLGMWACAGSPSQGTGLPEELSCTPGVSSVPFPDLPPRSGPPATTTGTVPHQQINPDVNPAVIAEMSGRIFTLAEVENQQSTIVNGATAIWLRESFNLARPECVIRGRELGHIHQDGSLHVTLPHDRIPGAVAAGWVERHPWADTRPGFEAYVMIFTPRNSSEVEVILDLVADGINFVQGN